MANKDDVMEEARPQPDPFVIKIHNGPPDSDLFPNIATFEKGVFLRPFEAISQEKAVKKKSTDWQSKERIGRPNEIRRLA